LNIAFLPQSSQVKMLFKSRLFSDGYDKGAKALSRNKF